MAAPQPLISNHSDFHQAVADPCNREHRDASDCFFPTIQVNWDEEGLPQEVMHHAAVHSAACLAVSMPKANKPLVSALHSLHRHIPITPNQLMLLSWETSTLATSSHHKSWFHPCCHSNGLPRASLGLQRTSKPLSTMTQPQSSCLTRPLKRA